jgi:hypothetical protein
MIMKRRRLILERDVYYSCVCMIERERGGGVNAIGELEGR